MKQFLRDLDYPSGDFPGEQGGVRSGDSLYHIDNKYVIFAAAGIVKKVKFLLDTSEGKR